MNDNVRVMRAVSVVLLVAIAVLLAYASPAAAAVETFWAEVDTEGNVTAGGGTGFMLLGGDDVWFYHESTDWWDQWFHSDAFDPNRRNEIDLTFGINRLDPDAGDAWAEITLNWSTPAWADETNGHVRPPVNEDVFIERAEPSLFEGEIGDFIIQVVDPPLHYVIEDYNPEWVSVDIRGYNFYITGGIDHQCVPTPGDTNLDGRVDGIDLTNLGVNWQQSPRTWAQGDFNADGIVDGIDLTILGVNWQHGVPEPPTEPVPEAATLGLLIIGGLALLKRRR